jgi:uncharacterized protein YecT (DUF1311 family)
MTPHRTLRAIGAAAAALALATGAQAAAFRAITPASLVIHERFTLLACPSKPSTTIQIEGCVEHRVISTDRTIDELNATIFAKFNSNVSRQAFVKANTAWVQYRDAICSTETTNYVNGSLAPIVYADCLVSIDHSHVGELRGMLKSLSPAG